MSLRNRAISSARWTLVRVSCIYTLQLAQLAILARILDPVHFGEIALVVMVLMVADVFSQTGIDLAIIRNQKEPDALLDSAWTIQLCRGLCLAGVIAAAAGPVASYFETPGLFPMLLVAAVVPFLDGTRNIGTALLVRELAQRRLVIAEVTVTAVGVISATILALTLRSTWALVINMGVVALLKTLASYIVHAHRPRLQFQWQRLRSLARFGIYVNLGVATTYLALNVDKFVLGKSLGTESLGIYERAFLLSNFIVLQMYSFLSATLFPTFSKLQGSPDRFRHHVRRFLMILAAGAAAWSGGLYLLSDYAIPLVFGAKFTAGIPVFEILLLHAGCHGISAGIHTLFILLNRPRLTFYCTAVQLVAVIIGLQWAVTAGSLTAVALAMGIGAACGLLCTLAFVARGALAPPALVPQPEDSPPAKAPAAEFVESSG
ncbi:MAG: oligosaccharide flippase family protein [Planctomycetota bacterium]